ncbi:hypothetical protein VF21_05920 [Pseudogymnoascus sp. 05NY08]|nr:hypothetical protein VF21_05920 [Pseudogymnoascus sp. 05NY08]
MVHLYGCTICKSKIPVGDNRVHCNDCGSEICGSCYLRKKISPLHKLDHMDYMMAEASGSMYVRPPAALMSAPQTTMGNTKEEKNAAALQTSAGVKRKRRHEDHANRPTSMPQKLPGVERKGHSRGTTVCERCRRLHQRCSGPTEEGWCRRCRSVNYLQCDFAKVAEDGTFDKEPSSGLSPDWSKSSAAPEPAKHTPSLGGASDGPSPSEDRESSSSESPQPTTRRRLLSRRNMPAYVFENESFLHDQI